MPFLSYLDANGFVFFVGFFAAVERRRIISRWGSRVALAARTRKELISRAMTKPPMTIIIARTTFRT